MARLKLKRDRHAAHRARIVDAANRTSILATCDACVLSADHARIAGHAEARPGLGAAHRRIDFGMIRLPADMQHRYMRGARRRVRRRAAARPSARGTRAIAPTALHGRPALVLALRNAPDCHDYMLLTLSRAGTKLEIAQGLGAVQYASSISSGGRNPGSTSSGSRLIDGRPVMNAMPTPPMSSAAAGGNRNCLAMHSSATIARNDNKTSLNAYTGDINRPR